MFVFLSIASLPYKNTYLNHDSPLFSINIFKECDTAGIKCVYWHAKSLEFDEPHPSLPIHHQCRCVLLPVTPLSDLVEESRPMAKADFMKEAERLYKAKYPNKDFAALADSTKKKYYYEAMREYERRTGEPAYTQVSGGVSFKDYFENHMTAQQQRDWLGPERYKLYKDFKLPLDRFIPPYPNKRMTIVELKEQDKASFNSIADKRNQKNTYNSVDFSATPDMQIIDTTANLRRLNTSNGKKQWDIIPDKVKNILKHPKIKDIPKNFMLKSDPDFFGNIIVNSNGKVISFDVAHNNPHGALTAVHETGHLLDKIFIKPEQRNRILQTVKSSSEYKNMLQHYNDLKGLKLSKKEKKHLGTLKTLLDEDELLARSFTEYISRKNKGEIFEQFKNDAILSTGEKKYFDSVNSEIASIYDELLIEFGL